jgi:hypothetical protein
MIMTMTAPLEDVGLACLPAAALPDLAEIRCEPDVTVALADGCAWVRWEPGDWPVLRRLLPVPGVRLYYFRDEQWYQPGRHLPDFDLPDYPDFRPLHEVLTPTPVSAVPAPALAVGQVAQPAAGFQDRLGNLPHRLRLVAGGRPHPTAALECDLVELARWADTVPRVRLASLKAAHCRGRVLVVGQRLPPVPGARRFWGQAVLVPLGYSGLLQFPGRRALGHGPGHHPVRRRRDVRLPRRNRSVPGTVHRRPKPHPLRLHPSPSETAARPRLRQE